MISSPSSTSAIIANAIIGLPPGVTTTWSGSTRTPRSFSEYLAMAAAEFGQAGRRAVVGPAFVDRALRRLADVLRRVEVGLADFEVDYVHLALEGLGAAQAVERGLGAEPVHPAGESHLLLLGRLVCGLGFLAAGFLAAGFLAAGLATALGLCSLAKS